MKLFIQSALLFVLVATRYTHAQQPPTPTPDPGPGAGGGKKDECECKIHMLTPAEMKAIGPKTSLQQVGLNLSPAGKTADPPADEWSGYDDLYRLAKETAALDADGTAEIGLKLKQGFEVYDGLPGADVGFGPEHEHPGGTVAFNIIFQTKEDPMRQVGIRLNGSVFITATVNISGSIAQPGVFLPHTSDSVSSVALSLSASHPLPKCVANDEQTIQDSITMTGSVTTEEEVKGNIAITAGNTEDSADGAGAKAVEKFGTTASGSYSMKVSKHVYSGSATIAKTVLIQGQTDRNRVVIPVLINGTISQNGMSDGGQAIGNVTANASIIWSGKATPCAMPAPVAPPAQGPPVIIIVPGGTF